MAGYKTFIDIAAQPPRFIEEINNTKRLHSTFGYVPSNELEEHFGQQAT